jgi:DNA-binding transcriptional MerR regulator
MDSDEILTTRDVSRILNRSSDCVRLYERTGKLAAQKTRSGQRLFRKSDVTRLAKEMRMKNAR